jgi:hypothetical protein
MKNGKRTGGYVCYVKKGPRAPAFFLRRRKFLFCRQFRDAVSVADCMASWQITGKDLEGSGNTATEHLSQAKT